MLEAHHRARSGPGGQRLQLQGLHAVEPMVKAVYAPGDPDYTDDVGVILASVVHGAIARFVNGEIAIRQILPTLERAVFRLTTNNQALAKAAGRARPPKKPTR